MAGQARGGPPGMTARLAPLPAPEELRRASPGAAERSPAPKASYLEAAGAGAGAAAGAGAGGAGRWSANL